MGTYRRDGLKGSPADMTKRVIGMSVCPYCKGEIEANVAACKHCGRDLRTGRKRVMFALFFVLLVILAALVFNWFVADMGGLWDSFY